MLKFKLFLFLLLLGKQTLCATSAHPAPRSVVNLSSACGYPTYRYATARPDAETMACYEKIWLHERKALGGWNDPAKQRRSLCQLMKMPKGAFLISPMLWVQFIDHAASLAQQGPLLNFEGALLYHFDLKKPKNNLYNYLFWQPQLACYYLIAWELSGFRILKKLDVNTPPTKEQYYECLTQGSTMLSTTYMRHLRQFRQASRELRAEEQLTIQQLTEEETPKRKKLRPKK